jgi:uncharacterized protein
MKIEGSHTLSVPRDKVWRMLQDPGVLAQATPGVEKLEATGDDRYKATLKLGVGPVRGTFSGNLAVTDKTPPEAMTLNVDGQGGPGGIRAQGRIRLEQQGDKTVVHYEGEPQISGRLAAVGGRLMSGVAKKMAAQFFESLERQAATFEG